MLTRPIGQGGMGTVWHARHPEGVDVAVKVLRPEFAADEEFMSVFRREVLAVASLDHPGIVRVYDFGVVSAQVAAAAGDQLSPGSPWLAMEHASGGTLADFRAETWDVFVDTLAQILAGLAHSHAHDIVHRDLKPRNVLIADGEGGARRIAVTDFGIAHALTRTHDEHAQAGTPGYMAPEQIRGAFRDLGPWTDLYAVGCLAWRLANGRSAYGGETKTAVLRAQIEGRTSRFEPLFPLADGAEPWIRRLLSPEPRDRFRCAADAAFALRELPKPGARSRPLPPRPEPPPQPTDWRPLHPPTTVRPAGTGLALFLLRPWPLVGRERIQDKLWTELRTVRETGHARCVVLMSPPGLGRSRVARWMAERAQETGAAWVLHVHHDSEGADGLAAAARSQLGIADLAPEEAWKRLTDWVAARSRLAPTEEAADLTSLLFRGALVGGQVPRPRLAPRDEYGGWFGLFDLLVADRRYERDRPLVLVVDDLHNSDLAPLLHALIGTARPVLAVATLDPSKVVPMAQPAIDRLRGRALALTLGPLSSEEQRQLVDAGVGLGARMADRIVERTGGNPSYAVNIVRDWVWRGLLVPTSTGYVLREGADVRLPEALVEQLGDRLDGLDATGRTAVEILATLGGNRVREVEWLAAGRHAGAALDPELLLALTRAGVVKRVAERGKVRWSIEPLLLRETALDAANAGGRLRAHHDACARGLLEVGREAARERAVVHLINAGHTEAALKTLRELIDSVRDQPERYASLVATESRLLDVLKVPRDDARRMPAALDRFAAEAAETPLPVLRERLSGLTADALAAARAHRIVLERLDVASRLGPDDPLLAAGDAWARKAGDLAAHAVIRRIRAQARVRAGDPEAAVAELEALRSEPSDDPAHRGRVALALAEAVASTAPERVEGYLGEAAAAFREGGDTASEIGVDVLRARLARRRGDLPTALDRARKALTAFGSAGLDPSPAALQIGLVRLVRGELAQARQSFEEVVARGDSTLATLARGGLLVSVSTLGDAWKEFDTVMAAWRSHGRDGALRHPDSGWPLEWAGKRAVDAGAFDRGSDAYELAAHQYALVGDREGLARMQRKLRAIAHTAPA